MRGARWLLAALLLAGCTAPRMTAHFVGPFAGEDVGDVIRFRLTCRPGASSPWGAEWLCQAIGESRLLPELWWRVFDGEGRLLSSSRGCTDVVVVHPPGAARLELLLPAGGWGRWRLAYSRELAPAPAMTLAGAS